MGIRDKEIQKGMEELPQDNGKRNQNHVCYHSKAKLEQVRRFQGQVLPESETECASDASGALRSRLENWQRTWG